MSIVGKTWLKSLDPHVFSLLCSRTQINGAASDMNQVQCSPFSTGGQQPGPGSVGGRALRAQRGRCRDTHRPEGWFPGSIQSGPCLFPASSLVPINSPIIPDSHYPSIPSNHKGFAVSFQHFEKITQGLFLFRVTGQGRERPCCTRQWSKSGVFLDSTSWHKH